MSTTATMTTNTTTTTIEAKNVFDTVHLKTEEHTSSNKI